MAPEIRWPGLLRGKQDCFSGSSERDVKTYFLNNDWLRWLAESCSFARGATGRALGLASRITPRKAIRRVRENQLLDRGRCRPNALYLV